MSGRYDHAFTAAKRLRSFTEKWIMDIPSQNIVERTGLTPSGLRPAKRVRIKAKFDKTTEKR